MRVTTMAVGAAMIAAATAGCAGEQAAQPTATVVSTATATVTATATATATVTATPAPSGALSAHDAWLLCVGRALPDLDPATFAILPFEADNAADQGDGTYLVQVLFQGTVDPIGGQATCAVGGEPDAPTVDYQGIMDFG